MDIPDWQELRERWVEDPGALLDAYVCDTNADDWQHAVGDSIPWLTFCATNLLSTT